MPWRVVEQWSANLRIYLCQARYTGNAECVCTHEMKRNEMDQPHSGVPAAASAQFLHCRSPRPLLPGEFLAQKK